MKSVFRFVPAALLAWSSFNALATEPLVRAGDRLAICGDSITEQKRYSVALETYLRACQPAALRPADVAQFGWGGERAAGLLARIDTDVAWFKPTVATTSYGMNDGGYYPPADDIDQVFREKLTAVVRKLKQIGVERIVVGSPGAVDSATFQRPTIAAATYNQTLLRLAAVAQEVAVKEGAAFADVIHPMLEVMAKAKATYGAAYHVAGLDGVHPATNGALVMAAAYLKALGCDGDIGTIGWDTTAGTATASEGHRVVAATATDLTLESTRYPYCFSGDPASPDSNRGIVAFFPFNEELNRFRLVVKGAGGRRAQLTWGEVTREFDAVELERGINLAAEFPDTPFAAAFAAVEKAVAEQQALETPLVKGVAHDAKAFRAAAPKTFAAFWDELRAERDRRTNAAGGAVRPVRHVLRLIWLP